MKDVTKSLNTDSVLKKKVTNHFNVAALFKRK